MEPPFKKFCPLQRQIAMATKKVDTVPEIMNQEHGTTVLITDRAADKFLAKAAKENPNQKKFTEFCGCKGGWSDYTERWH
jgi:hypothetical protein